MKAKQTASKRGVSTKTEAKQTAFKRVSTKTESKGGKGLRRAPKSSRVGVTSLPVEDVQTPSRTLRSSRVVTPDTSNITVAEKSEKDRNDTTATSTPKKISRRPSFQSPIPRKPSSSSSSFLASSLLSSSPLTAEASYGGGVVGDGGGGGGGVGGGIGKLPVSSAINMVYKKVNEATGSLGGNGSFGGSYGELTKSSMHKVLSFLAENCEFSILSRFLDVGSGRGKPNFHASQHTAPRVSIGVEVERIRWQLSLVSLQSITPYMREGLPPPSASAACGGLQPGVSFLLSDVDCASTLDAFTHIYMYDLGFPPDLQRSIARKFNTSVHCRYLVSYRPPHRVIDMYGYNVEPRGQVLTSMHGSGESHTCYFYKRTGPFPKEKDVPASIPRVTLPGRPHFNELATTVVCDPLFRESFELAAGSISTLEEKVRQINTDFLNREREMRSTSK